MNETMSTYNIIVATTYPLEVTAINEEEAKKLALRIISRQYDILPLHWKVSELKRLKQKDEVNLCPMCGNEVGVEDELCLDCESEHGNNLVVI